MEELAALNFNVRETLWKLEEIREKIKKLNAEQETEKELKKLFTEHINNCTSSLLVINDFLNEIENCVNEYEVVIALNNQKVS